MPLDALQVRDELRRRVDHTIHDFEGWYRSEKGGEYLRAEESAVLRALDLRPGLTAIDAGSGGGRFTLLLAERCRQVRAVDLSEVAARATLRRARGAGHHHVTAAVADIAEGIPGDPADRVVSVQAIQHIPTGEGRLRAVVALSRALRPGGRLVISVFNGGRWMDRLRGRARERVDPTQAWYYYYRFLPAELATLLRAAGLEQVRVRAAVNLPGRVYRWPGSGLLAPLDRALGASPAGLALGIYLVATGLRPAGPPW